MVVFLAKPSSPARHALDLLASWTDVEQHASGITQPAAENPYAGRRGPAER
jgi:hypothetical protein